MAKIMLVEDTVDLAQTIIKELQGANYTVKYVEDGLTALQVYQPFEPDLIILDWMLPDLSGLDVLKQIRRFSPVPILILTARDAEEDRILGLRSGADDYLTKPFSMGELLARIEALLRRVEMIRRTIEDDASQSQAPLQFENLFINPVYHEAQIDGQSIELSVTEFKLLHLLVRNAGRVFSREYLLDVIWENQFSVGDRAVDNAISRLRKKLGRYEDYLEAKWGVGYKWRKE